MYYFDPFSPVAKLNSVRFIHSLAANLVWPLYQRDVKIAFLHGDLHEEVYMELRPGMSLNDKKNNSFYGFLCFYEIHPI